MKLRKSVFTLLNVATLVAVATLYACSGEVKDPKEEDNNKPQAQRSTKPNNFNADSAYLYVQKQVDFGPRVPNSTSHINCGNWLTQMLKTWCDTVYVQTFVSKSYKGVSWNGKNVIGVINPKSVNRLLLCAHWDTRPEADQDPLNPKTPSDGANDGGSGVGILLEVARQLHLQKPGMGIDIIFFDLEDGGANDGEVERSWCLGSQYWANHQHVLDYRAKNGILLDMVGAKDALFAREEMSVRFANDFLSRVWQTGTSLGFGNHFINYNKSGITDDHVYVSYEGKVPTIDIIEYDSKTPTGFGTYWHTHQDNMQIIDKNTLNAVGKTVLQVVLNSDAELPVQ